MRNVYPTDKIAHLWAHQTQESARNPGGNFYFNGPTIYSYGSHFVCAHIMPREHYGATVLVNSGSYSNTTGKHQGNTVYAIPGDMRKIYVSGLSGNDLYISAERGARDVVEKLVKEFRADIANAATVKNVRAATRGGNLASAIRRLADLRFILECDAKRKAAYARPMLRKLPTVSDLPAKDARTAAETFAAKVLREQYREELQRITAGMERDLAYARAYAAGNISGDGWRDSAENALTRANDARLQVNSARHAAKLGGARIPASVTAATKALPAIVAALETMDAKETRAKNAAEYMKAHQELREILASAEQTWRLHDRLQTMKRAARDLSSLDGESERAERIAEIEHARGAVDSAEKASAPERALSLVQLAGEHYRNDKLDDAERLARKAATLDAGRAPDAEQLIAACEARREVMQAERIAAWRNGDNVSMPHDADAGAMLRVKDGTIETSWGADVPVSVAPLVWRIVNGCRANNAAHEFTRDNAPRLGHFALDKVDASGDIHAGCHFIKYQELQGVAATLKF